MYCNINSVFSNKRPLRVHIEDEGDIILRSFKFLATMFTFSSIVLLKSLYSSESGSTVLLFGVDILTGGVWDCVTFVGVIRIMHAK